jgi:hypothetical protein
MNSLRGEYAAELQREEKTPRRFTIAWRCCILFGAERRWERGTTLSGGWECESGTPSIENYTTYLFLRDHAWWVVGLGWYAPEKASGAPKGLLR